MEVGSEGEKTRQKKKKKKLAIYSKMIGCSRDPGSLSVYYDTMVILLHAVDAGEG